MKHLSQLAKKELAYESNNKLVHFFFSSTGYLPIDPPAWSQDLVCPFCGESGFFLLMVDKDRRAWGCSSVCKGSRLPQNMKDDSHVPEDVRCLPWASYCELNGLGDLCYDVKFEHIHQSKAKIDYMLKFATNPRGIIFMHGDPGLGKTYAAMAICEYFTRKSRYCIFTTQKQMASNWLQELKDSYNNYPNIITNTPLLVIDDFGTGDPSPKFLEFFMEVINTRLQWSNRGTVITTNLKIDKFNDFCGEALADRIMTGQIFTFTEGESRRKKLIL